MFKELYVKGYSYYINTDNIYKIRDDKKNLEITIYISPGEYETIEFYTIEDYEAVLLILLGEEYAH